MRKILAAIFCASVFFNLTACKDEKLDPTTPLLNELKNFRTIGNNCYLDSYLDTTSIAKKYIPISTEKHDAINVLEKNEFDIVLEADKYDITFMTDPDKYDITAFAADSENSGPIQYEIYIDLKEDKVKSITSLINCSVEI